MNILNVTNKIKVVTGHASHLSQATAELGVMLATPELDLTGQAPEIRSDLKDASAIVKTASDNIKTASAALGKDGKKSE